MKKLGLFFVIGLMVLTGCSPRSYFLINSDSVVRYDRMTGKFELIWRMSAQHLYQDSTDCKRDSVVLIPVDSYKQ